MNICLDSWAVLNWLEDGPSAAAIEKTIPSRPVISLVNVCEVLYVISRKHGDRAIQQVLPALRQNLSFIEVNVGIVEPATNSTSQPIASNIALSTLAINEADDQFISAIVIFPHAAFAEVLSNKAAATAPKTLVVNLILEHFIVMINLIKMKIIQI